VTVKFKGRLTATPRGGGGTLVPVPRDVAAKLGLKGMPRIQAVIAGTPYRGSLMPMGDGTYCLGVLKSIQEAAGVGLGEEIDVELELDTAPRTVDAPPDLAAALARDRKAAAAWETLSYTNRKEIARSLEEAKRPETRERRLSAALERLSHD
jgi:thioredoxin-like negative regulator of GroEL